jgi:glycerol-3-phosphate acyltransferase PlsY
VDYGAYIAVLLMSYFLGSVPSGFLAGKARGVDVRTVGSGNIGATNAFRALGKTAGTLVLLADAFKGFAAARWLPLLTVCFFPDARPQQENLALAAGIGAILGHNFTCWLNFKGGKGIATSAGVVLAWAPLACLTALALWGIVFVITKFVSVASIAAALVLPPAVWFFSKGSVAMTAVMAALSALAIYKHKGNIQRLVQGTELRAGAKKS